MKPAPAVLDVGSAANVISEQLGVPVAPTTLYNWIRRKRVPYIRYCGRVGIPQDELAAWLAGLEKLSAREALTLLRAQAKG